MNVKLAYLGRSALTPAQMGLLVSLVPNLARDPVAFDAPLRHPLRFREAISALHDVVVSDQRFRKRDRAAYLAWKAGEARRAQALREGARQRVATIALERERTPLPPGLEGDHAEACARYWGARQAYARHIARHDMALWRKLMPCDPVVTIAPDVALFECFSADESSYGCLRVEREGSFGADPGARCGTTNVDYSGDLHASFQALRTYRETRFRLDPLGFTVATEGREDYREEKIDLPPGWLRGFLQVQVAMGLPARKVSLSREAVYSILAWHRRHRAQASPRALRFELTPGQAPRLCLEPWERAIESTGTRYDGPPGPPVRVWGARRLLALARLLPLADGVDVHLLGTGLPHFWVVRMGEMRFTLGLSGWTKNDWTRGSALDLLLPPVEPSRGAVDAVRDAVKRAALGTLPEIERAAGSPGSAVTIAALAKLAHAGQVIHDLPGGVYRWRQILPQALGEAEIGPEGAEVLAARAALARREAAITRREATGALTLVAGQVGSTPVEIVLDGDGRISKAQCPCSHHHTGGLRRGPCRHILALRLHFEREGAGRREAVDATTGAWYEAWRRWAGS